MTIPTSSIDQIIPGQGAMAQPAEARPAKAKRRRFRFVANAKAATGLIILGIYVLFAIIGPWVAPYDPDARSDDLVQPPSADALVRHHPPRPGRASARSWSAPAASWWSA